jgi:predicted transcriptional regulator
MINETLQDLGLAANEGWIYETLLREGECGVSTISSKAGINRRNVYDSLNRLIEKGLVLEIRTAVDNRYSAVNPSKLGEIIEEKQKQLASIMPQLEAFYTGTPKKEEVFVYRGLEGWKNYLRDMLRIGEDNYTIGGVGAWTDPRLTSFMDRFLKDAEKKGMTFHILFNHEVQDKQDMTTFLPHNTHKFLPKGYTTGVAIDIFGDHIVTLSGVSLGTFDENSSFTVVINQEIADAYRTWFRLIWDLLPETKK